MGKKLCHFGIMKKGKKREGEEEKGRGGEEEKWGMEGEEEKAEGFRKLFKGFQSERVVISIISNNPNFKIFLRWEGGHPFQTFPSNALFGGQ